jgi:transcriptional regulator with XRE-family HTH domain
MISRKVFSQRLNKLRQKKNISHEKLANELGLTRTTISHWENGIRLPSLETAAALADYFDVSLDYLVGRSDDPRRR